MVKSSRATSVRALRAAGLLTRRQMLDAQREQLLWAMVAVTAAQGAPETTVATVTEHAGVSRSTFYEHFATKEDCYRAALDLAFEQLRQHVCAVARDAGRAWTARLRAGLAALLEALDREPALAHLCLITAPVGDSDLLETRRRALERVRGFVEEGRPTRGSGAHAPDGVAMLALDGTFELIGRSYRGGRKQRPLLELLNELAYVFVALYRGPGPASDQLRLPPPHVPPLAPLPDGREPILSLAVPAFPLTPREAAILAFLEAHPGAASGEVAEAIGTATGTVSRQLGRLRDRGLISGVRAGRVLRSTLTAQGARALAQTRTP